MERKDFVKLIKTLQEKNEQSAQIHTNYNIDLIGYTEDLYNIIGLLMSYLFTEEGWDWIIYFLHGRDCKVWDKEGGEIPFETIDNLYDFLNQEGYIPKDIV